MSEKQVMVWPRGQITSDDRRRLRDAGILVVEADNPQAVVQVVPGAPIISQDVALMAALDALCLDAGFGGQEQRAMFTRNLRAAMKAKLAAPEAAPNAAAKEGTT